MAHKMIKTNKVSPIYKLLSFHLTPISTFPLLSNFKYKLKAINNKILMLEIMPTISNNILA